MGSTIAIIRIVIWLDKPNSQSLNYAIKTRPTASSLVAVYVFLAAMAELSSLKASF